VERRGLPWHEAISKVAKKPMSLKEVKEWRTREADAGRPSSYADYCRAYGLCATCLGEGITRNDIGIGFKVVGMDSQTQLFEQCPVCGGTGVLPAKMAPVSRPETPEEFGRTGRWFTLGIDHSDRRAGHYRTDEAQLGHRASKAMACRAKSGWQALQL
jgi:hypothetical protein